MGFFKQIARVLFASYFIMAGWHVLQNFPDGGMTILNAFRSHNEQLRTKLPGLHIQNLDMGFMTKYAESIRFALAYMLLGFGGLSAFGYRFSYVPLACLLLCHVNLVHCVLGIKSADEFLLSFKGWSLECALIGFCLTMLYEAKKMFPGKGVRLSEFSKDNSYKARPGGQSIPRKKDGKNKSQRD